jgi:hypothetical protein
MKYDLDPLQSDTTDGENLTKDQNKKVENTLAGNNPNGDSMQVIIIELM